MTVRGFTPGGPERYEHQKRGLRKIIETRGRAALLFDPGTGKTATAIDYISLLALRSPRQEARVLVVAPSVAIDTWVDQMGKWASPQISWWAEALGGSLMDRAETLAYRGGRPYRKRPDGKPLARDAWPSRGRRARRALAWDYAAAHGEVLPRGSVRSPDDLQGPRALVVSMAVESFQQRHRVGSRTIADVLVDAVARFDPDLLIVDESHRIKSPSSNVSRTVYRFAQHVPRRLLLTGTVMPHSPLDVFAQWRVLDPTALGDLLPGGARSTMTFPGFRARYARLGGWMGKEVIGFHRLDELQDRMARNAVVARKADALDLPKTTEVIVPVHLSTGEARAYREMRDNLAATLGPGSQTTSTSRLAQMMRLRQITSGHLPDDAGQVHQIGTAKVDTVRGIVRDHLGGEKRVVIFALFSHEIHALASALEEKGTEVRVIEGATPTKERKRIREEFGSDDPRRIVLVAQIKTISLAVNELVTASHAVFASLSQQRDDLVQARDRLDRIGQTLPVTFWYAIAPGTVDEVILQSHRDRTSLEDAMLKHVSEGLQ